MTFEGYIIAGLGATALFLLGIFVRGNTTDIRDLKTGKVDKGECGKEHRRSDEIFAEIKERLEDGNTLMASLTIKIALIEQALNLKITPAWVIGPTGPAGPTGKDE
jgi:hypothetical protein